MKFRVEELKPYQSDGGILRFGMMYSIQTILNQRPKEILTYKHGADDLIEVRYVEGEIVIFTFPYTKFGVDEIFKNNLSFWESYFDTGGLKNTRFLFDVTLKMPVRYSDFHKDISRLGSPSRIAYIVESKKDGYITEIQGVNILVCGISTYAIDSSAYAMIVNLGNFDKPSQQKTLEGCLATSVIAGLFNGVLYGNIERQLENIEPDSKFLTPVKEVILDKMPSERVTNGLTVKSLFYVEAKGSAISYQDDGEYALETVNISRLIAMGLDKFIKTIKDPHKKIQVNHDVNFGIKLMYILDGAAFVILQPRDTKLSAVKELLTSDNIFEILQ